MKLVDGFVTNSSTQSSTVLFAVPKNLNFGSILNQISKKYPEDFLEFGNRKSDLKQFLETPNLDLTYLLNEYDLYVNTISDIAPKNVVENFDRIEKISEMVEEIKNLSKDNILIVFFGDSIHDGISFKPPPLYTKQKVLSIFKSDDIKSMRSLIQNEIVANLKFNKQELADLTQNLIVPLEKLIGKPRKEFNYTFYPFYPEYYHIFGKDYIEALLRLTKTIHIEPKPQHPYGSPWRLDGFAIEVLKAQLMRSYLNDWLKDEGEFYRVVPIIDFFFGKIELIRFINETTYFDEVIIDYDYYHNSDVMRYSRNALSLIAGAVISHINNSDKKISGEAKKVHDKLMRVLKALIEADPIYRSEEVILDIMQNYHGKRQPALLSPLIKSIDQEVLLDFLKGARLAFFKKWLIYYQEGKNLEDYDYFYDFK
ncbi:MAG: hypothetical protein ACFE9R_20160 [Candidatus Hermodarchaeota archaeon]